ncbi:Ist2p ASCRUDRAFT_149968 [Ascoidea rubescens DSM 1968]|uniref:DUF590-domain-containing protein n=1 Tax=Ascoidea rubescens DSM 1968 TaxID=1344418 RepID=A0A1D2VGU7_9ASCO|nr:hypothetical protein ASCRUDRAFT_149968 [Ascoidea rubescens DSM 1968]ODV60770.1 hypothetical protein ASCRUDRAFT_149968 [Ascoidea rubescens DSM 1968]
MEDPSFSSISIEDLDPDFVISVKYPIDPASNTPTDQANSNLKTLVEKLTKYGFLIQIRPGYSNNSLLLFIKLRPSILKEKYLINYKINDWIYNINEHIISNDSNENSVNDNLESSSHLYDTLSNSERLRIIYNILIDDSFLALTPNFNKWDFITNIQPIHDRKFNKNLLKIWSFKRIFINDDDINLIKNQFGEKVALYFAFLNFYSFFLIFPSVFGLVTYFSKNYYLNSKFSSVYTFFNFVWGIVFIQAWRRKEKIYAISWKTKNSDKSALKNFKFIGEILVNDYVTGNQIPYYYPWKRFLKKLSFFPLALSSALILIIWQFFCFIVEIITNEVYDGPLKSVVSLIPTVMLSAFVPILTFIYNIFVTKMVEWENHRTQLSYQRSLNEKLFIISFLTSYMALFITSYVYLPFAYLINPYIENIHFFISTYISSKIPLKQNEPFVINPDRLHKQFFFAIVINQVLGFFLESVVPKIQSIVLNYLSKDKKINYNDKPSEKAYLDHVRKEVFQFDDYDVNTDYREMIVQYGFLIMFSQAWTVAPIICLLSNWFEFRGDAVKIFTQFKRSIPERIDSIYPWNQYLFLLTWLGSIVGPSITAMYGYSRIMFNYKNDSVELNILNVESKNLILDKLSDRGYLKSAVNIKSWKLLSIILISEHFFFISNFVIETILNKIKSKEESENTKREFKLRKGFALEKFPSVDLSHNIEKELDNVNEKSSGDGKISEIEEAWVKLNYKSIGEILDDARSISNRVVINEKVKKEGISKQKEEAKEAEETKEKLKKPLGFSSGVQSRIVDEL